MMMPILGWVMGVLLRNETNKQGTALACWRLGGWNGVLSSSIEGNRATSSQGPGREIADPEHRAGTKQRRNDEQGHAIVTGAHFDVLADRSQLVFLVAGAFSAGASSQQARSPPQSTLGAQAAADLLDACLAFAQGLSAGVYRVIAEHQVVRMLDGRAEDELGVGLGVKGDGLVRLLEERELAGLQRIRRAEASAADRAPGDRVLLGRSVRPAFARLERN